MREPDTIKETWAAFGSVDIHFINSLGPKVVVLERLLSVEDARAIRDDLAAASQPESLVGRHVRFKDNWAEMGTVLEEGLFRIQPNLNPDFNSIVKRDDFELLEADE